MFVFKKLTHFFTPLTSLTFQTETLPEIHILNKKAEIIDYSKYDHIVEGGLVLKSGFLQVLDCPNSIVELKVKLKPGYYRVRIYFSNIVGYNADKEESSDNTKIEVWPDAYTEPQVLKMYNLAKRRIH